MKQLLKIIPLLLLFACAFLEVQAQQPQRSGVYVNGEEITMEDVYFLQYLIGPIYQGQYYLDEQGNFGVVGYYPSCNLIQILAYMQQMSQAYQQQTPQQGSSTPSQSSYQSAQNGGGFYWREGGQSGYINNRTDVSVTPAGRNSVISIGGRVLNIP
ncbi:MAG: hypothetical protein AAFR59_01245 [Bacteroidota bacterium]